MLIKSFAPCSDWFFVYVDSDGKRCETRLAGWALTTGHDGADALVGMIAAEGKLELTSVPCVAGSYRHESEMPRPIEL
ncbi:hypothetical protein [Propionivibrio limicola]|uniref:hypothetical protein n=1 Tax=Propionivibrio limicola TaxID=167645 RepID=UPI001291F0F6|nr:hypothetical protein [Propionivibrio limicola]